MTWSLHSFGVVALGLIALTMPRVQASQEFIIIDVRGATHTWALPAEWTPAASEGYLVLPGRARLPMNDVAAVRPRDAGNTSGRHAVEVVFPCRTGKELHQTFWLPDAYAAIADLPLRDGFRTVDERTLIREGSYRPDP